MDRRGFGVPDAQLVPDAATERLEVRAVPSPPAGRWLVAADVRLWEEFEREPNELVAGEPLIRLLGVRVEGSRRARFRNSGPGRSEFSPLCGTSEYEDTVTGAGLVGVRRQRAALLALRGGDVVLPQSA